MKHPCACCGFLVFREPLGTYDICPVCGWEDDEVQTRWPGYRGGANTDSLCGEQARFLSRASNKAESTELQRHPAWRPLRADECLHATADPNREPYVYYWDRDQSV